MDQPLIIKYRPEDWDQVVGHKTIVEVLKRAIYSSSRPHGYLFTGVAGLGKTTLARITAKEIGCELTELDAASHSGADDMRSLIDNAQYRGFSGSGSRMFLIDECHRLSRTAWDVLLKTLEEPPAHLYFAFCTTEPSKVPSTIVSRCFHSDLRPLKQNELSDLIDTIASLEEWKLTSPVRLAIIQESNGQPRRAISLLQALHSVTSREEVRRIIALQDAGEPLIELIQALLKGATWSTLAPIFQRIEEEDFAEASVVAGRYLAAVILRAETEVHAQPAWDILNALTFPTETFDKKVAFLTAIGRIIWGQ